MPLDKEIEDIEKGDDEDEKKVRATLEEGFRTAIDGRNFLKEMLDYLLEWEPALGEYKIDGKTFIDAFWEKMRSKEKLKKADLDSLLDKYLNDLDVTKK